MSLKLKINCGGSPAPPFSWDSLSTSPSVSPPPSSRATSPPTLWLSAKDMKIYGSEPLKAEIGIVRCKECMKPVLKSAVLEHNENCRKIREGDRKKAAQGKADVDDKKGKKRKADEEDLNEESSKKKKTSTKITKGRFKGPIDYDKQCGVINDKGLPCSRSLTCKSHAMGAKRAVEGRSRPYNDLLLDWNRANNPNFVEPVKRESKAEKKEKKEKEKAEKKRLQGEAVAAAQAVKPTNGSAKKKKPPAPLGIASVETMEDYDDENLEDIDSEAELEKLLQAVRTAHKRGTIGVPLAVPTYAGSWFVGRRERLRNCTALLAGAFQPMKTMAPGVLN